MSDVSQKNENSKTELVDATDSSGENRAPPETTTTSATSTDDGAGSAAGDATKKPDKFRPKKLHLLPLGKADPSIPPVDINVMRYSNHIQTLLNDTATGTADPMPIELDTISAPTLKKIIEWCEYYRWRLPTHVPRPLITDDLKSFLTEWELEYIEIPNAELSNLIIASDFLDIPPLLDLCSVKIAALCKGKSVEEINAMFPESPAQTAQSTSKA